MNMALIHAKNEEYPKSLQILGSVARSQEARFGPNSEHFIQTTGLIGYLQVKNMEFNKGFKCLQTVSDWQDKHLKSSHASVELTQSIVQTSKKCAEGKASIWV